MLSNQVLHGTLKDISEITGTDCSVFDMEGNCLVSTAGADFKAPVTDFLEGDTDESADGENALFKVKADGDPVYIFCLHRTGEMDREKVILSGRLSVSQISNLLRAGEERLDRNRFVQNLLLDNMLLVDIYNQAQKLKITVEERRAVFLIEPKKEGDSIVLETLKGLYATGTKDFVTAVDERHVILVKALESTEDYRTLGYIAKAVAATLNTEAMVDVRVAYGTIVGDLKDVSKSYKEAGMALDVGRIFYEERNILAYKELGIGRLIHQLPISLCEMFLDEVFAGKAVSQFDEETLGTVNRFFENNLNISETARQLYVHRNTLVYRLEKIQKTTGLDVRVFEDALTFKIALMVSSHIHANR